ncbi:MAG: NUDIX domain-containing protein [Tabrizicola sp.]|jgi:nudix-type nucleoside diphosphatase (YffH/AdpP family)|nr:NUDIX domain-containing protein [Tabrizicola sp.]
MPDGAGNSVTPSLQAVSADLRLAVLDGADPGTATARLGYLAGVVAAAGTDWSIFAGTEGAVLARLVLRALDRLSPGVVGRRLGALRVEAASRVRAAGASARGQRVGSGEVEAGMPEPSHAGFFGLDLWTLRHRRFDGRMSPKLRREVFVMGDAVTVLPYDPARDRVLLIEQLRMGPLGRGDPLPWQLEAIAGRIDPGETPEAAARREAVEEAGLLLGALEQVAEYYPTPGAVTEYLYSYVALCDLPDGVAGVHGAAAEAEDIQGHLVSFDRLVELLASGEIGNAPLLLTVLWLQRERARLRGT